MHWQVKSIKELVLNAEVSRDCKNSLRRHIIYNNTLLERRGGIYVLGLGGGWLEQPQGGLSYTGSSTESKEFTGFSSSITKSSDSFPSCSKTISSKPREWGPFLVIHSTNINGPDQMGHSKVLEKNGTQNKEEIT